MEYQLGFNRLVATHGHGNTRAPLFFFSLQSIGVSKSSPDIAVESITKPPAPPLVVDEPFGEKVDFSSLKNPARIGCSSAAFFEVDDTCEQETSLDTYMRLPVEQYFILDPSMIEPLGENRFKLQVPRLNFFNVSLF